MDTAIGRVFAHIAPVADRVQQTKQQSKILPYWYGASQYGAKTCKK
jgi:hypothetical protein